MNAEKHASPPQHPLYFVNAWVDGALIGGLALLSLVLIKLFHNGTRTDMVIYLGATLSWIVNWPHFSATSYRLYQSADNVRQYFITATVVPVFIILTLIGSFLSPEGLAPYLVKVFTIWSPYHFSGQTLGITLIYARRAGFQIQKWERRALSGFIYGTFLFQSTRAETFGGTATFYSITYPLLHIPAWIPSVMAVSMYASGAALVVLAVRQLRASRKPIPWIMFLPVVTQYIWFVYGSGLAAFQEFVPFFHSLQYLLIAWSMELHLQAEKRGVGKPVPFILGRSLNWALINFAGGATLFYGLPLLFSRFGWQLGFTTAVILCAVQIHHFFVDGVIWKLKRKTVSSPLMSNIAVLFQPALGTGKR
ncbi:MAG: hypothetical protein ACXVB9_06090 [Bdellovibrionota bacterium]